ncbi:uncharacterized protein LAJ45_06895 [Morchella importuna]|uniref:uncharacterized protein n=1 Tax=Morchella importuna TaxID=1174673 RepID=UPI001E8E9162|nr:uncharacterized protein LAJ45_06895 [Morchella importuna]KAH8148921.1 hypothetical protein LAJ45_06895 [Morchella importuna]
MKIQPLKGEGVLSCLSLHGVQPGVCLVSNCTRKSALLNRRKERGSSLFILWVYQLSPVQVGALTTNIVQPDTIKPGKSCIGDIACGIISISHLISRRSLLPNRDLTFG